MLFPSLTQDAAEYSMDVLHARDQYSMTALMHAVASYQLECAALILESLKAHSESMRMQMQMHKIKNAAASR